jgi:hypothetical protein
MPETFTLTQSEIDAIAKAAANSTAKEQQDALASRESFIRWLKTWGLNFIANKIGNWALDKIKTLWSRLF